MTGELLDLGEVEVDEFAEFWQVYPRHKDRARAEGLYRRARKLWPAEVILSAAREYAAEVDGKPTESPRRAVEWLRAEPWRPDAAPLPPVPPPRARRRRDPSKPRRAPARTAPARPLTVAQQKAKWCREHGVTVEQYDERKEDREWIETLKRRGKVA